MKALVKPTDSMHDPTALVACVNMNFFKTELHKLCVTTSGDRIGETVSDINCARSDVKVCVDVDILAVKNKFFSNVAKLY